MKKTIGKAAQRARRVKRIRAKISGTAARPRLSIFKSNRYISAQLIDDVQGVTLAAAHSKTMKAKTLVEKSALVGKAIAEAAKGKGISEVVFDRGGYQYTGSVARLADGAREEGLVF